MKWLTEMGADMRTIPTPGEYPEFPGGAENVCWSEKRNGFQRLWLLLMENAFEKRKVRVKYETPAMELIPDNKTGEIRGVVGEDKGRKIYVKAKKAVAICTGGFENNQEMIRDYLGMPCGYSKGSPYNTGDGIRMAMAAEFVPAFTNTQGGPRRNHNAQVLDTNHKPIPRFYSAGEMGALYSWHYQGGGNILECLVFGRIAGEAVAAEKPWG